MLRLLIAALCLFASGCQTGGARNDDNARIAQIEAILPPAVIVEGRPANGRSLADAMVQDGVPGLSIAMIRNGEIAWTRQYGVTTAGGPPIARETRFQAGSVSKPITALGALALVEDGAVTFDEDVNAHLTRWHPQFAEGVTGTVTLGGLLSHTAGASTPGFPGYRTDAQAPTLLQVLNGEPPANTEAVRVVSAPGSRRGYSGGGYEIVQLLIEDVSRQSFADWMVARVFQRMGMTHSGYEQRVSDAARGAHAMAHDAAGAIIEAGPHIYPEQAAAGLWSTPSDIARAMIWVQEALAGEHGGETRALVRRMLTDTPPSRGMGFDVGGAPGARWFSKSGDTEGFGAFVVAYENGDGAVVMANGQSGATLARDVVRAIALAYGWPDFGSRTRTAVALSDAEMARLVGRYRYRAGEFTVGLEDGSLFISSPGDEPDRAFAASAHEIFTQAEDASFVFDASAGPAQQGHILVGISELTFQRLE